MKLKGSNPILDLALHYAKWTYGEFSWINGGGVVALVVVAVTVCLQPERVSRLGIECVLLDVTMSLQGSLATMYPQPRVLVLVMTET